MRSSVFKVDAYYIHSVLKLHQKVLILKQTNEKSNSHIIFVLL